MQKDFNKLIKLIKNQNNTLIIELLSHFKNNEITYSTFSKESCKNNKEHLTKTYQERWEMGKIMNDNQFIQGFEELIPKLRETKFNNINISEITTEIGTYLLFTDDKKESFIEILKSKGTLKEIRDMYKEHKKLVESTGKTVLYDYEDEEIVFLNGIHQKK